MKEPRVESNIYDLTGNLANAPADDGYPIAGAVFTPAGPIEKRKVLSQRDFIDNYLLSSTVLPTDNESIKFIFKLLELNPVYIIRACPVAVLEGISSTGTKLLFDKSFALLPSYKKLKLAGILDLLNYYSISIPNGTTTPDTFYAEATAEEWVADTDYSEGDVVFVASGNTVNYYSCKEDHTSSAQFSKDLDYWAKVSQFPSSIPGTRIGDTKSLNALFDGIIDAANAQRFNSNIMASAPGYISSRVALTNISENIGKFTEVKNAIRLCQAESDKVLASIDTPETVSERNYLSIDGYSYYFQGTGKLGIPKVDAPFAITSPNTISKISREYFMLKVMAEADVTREGGFGRLGVTLGNGDAWGVTFTSCNVPGMLLDEINGTELAMTSNRYFVPSDLTVSEGYNNKFAYVALKIADPSATSEAAGESSDSDEDSPIVYRYRIYTWGSKAIGGVDELDADMERNRELVAELLGVSVSDISWDNPDLFQIVRISRSDSRISVSRFMSKVLDRLINSEKTVENDISVQIYDSSNTQADRAHVNFTGTLVMTTSEDNPMSSDFFEVTTDTESKRNFYQYYVSTDADNEEYRKADFLSVTIDDTIYYTGNVQAAGGLPLDLTQVSMSESAVTLDEFSSLLQYHAYVNQGLCIYEGSFVLPDIESEVSFSENLNLQISDPIIQNTMDQFAIVQKFPAAGSVFQFSFNKSEENPDILELELNYKLGTMKENWTMSFVPGVVNGYGIDQFYTRVNNDYFKVVNLAGDGNIGDMLDSYTSPYFGKSVAVPDYNVQYMKDAMQTLPEYEDGLYYYMLTDSGVINPGYASVIQTLCSQLHSWYPVSLPDTMSTADLISFVGSAGLDSYYARMLAASDRMDIAGFSSVIPGSFKLIQSVLSLYRSQSNEFAPNYDLRNGSIGMSNPTQSFKKPARERLLDYKIETLKGGIGTDYYINDNITAQKSTSYMSENQNVLMTIVAVHECESIARSYKAELNTATTRKRLEDALNSALQSRLFKGKAYTPYSYYAVCNASNNPLQVINNNQLVADIYAQFTPSAKVIILNHYIIPLDQS